MRLPLILCCWAVRSHFLKSLQINLFLSEFCSRGRIKDTKLFSSATEKPLELGEAQTKRFFKSLTHMMTNNNRLSSLVLRVCRLQRDATNRLYLCQHAACWQHHHRPLTTRAFTLKTPNLAKSDFRERNYGGWCHISCLVCFVFSVKWLPFRSTWRFSVFFCVSLHTTEFRIVNIWSSTSWRVKSLLLHLTPQENVIE